MAQTKEGAIKVAAKKTGVTVSEYIHRTKILDMKWCSGCKEWHGKEKFCQDSSRWDGLSGRCKEYRNSKARSDYTLRPLPLRGRSFVPARDGDKLQARRRINYFVEAGLIPPPNELHCVDCGHEWAQGQKRHEYDHYLGYSAEHHESVQVVCSECHHRREHER